MNFNGLGLHLGNLSRLSNAHTRSISAENYKGEPNAGALATDGTGKTAARDLGVGWKVSPSISIAAGETRELADIAGPGAIQQIWMTGTNLTHGGWRNAILRVYWDNQTQPSVECPMGDFFACGWNRALPIASLPVCVNASGGLNCYWEMPFRKHCRVTIENDSEAEFVLYYQINYTLTDVPDDCAYFHAQFRRTNPLPHKSDYTLLDGVAGRGHYVGTFLCWGANNNGWWGEGEIKFFLDGDQNPTICGTGTEDYFGGAWCFNDAAHGTAPDVRPGYVAYSTPYSGFNIVPPDGHERAQTRFNMYRWHILDPIRFQENLRVTMQAIGWRSGGRYLPLQDDLSSVTYWYQTLPTAPFPVLPDRDAREII